MFMGSYEVAAMKMNKRLISTLAGAMLLGMSADLALAEDESAAESATDPSAVLAQIGFLFWNTIPESGDLVAETLVFQPVLPLSKNNVLRPALPLISTPGPNRETGIGDLFLLDVWIFQAKNASWGVGPVLSLPTASHDSMGTGKYQAGPAAMYLYKGVPKNLFGILGYNLTSFAGDGDREDVNKFLFQPIWVSYFDWGYMGWTDQTAFIDWENDNAYSIPVGFRFGKVFTASEKTLMNLAVGVYYTYNSDSDNVYGLKITGTFVKPGWLNH